MYYGTTISYVLLTISGSTSSVNPATFSAAIGNSIGISAERIVIQNVIAGAWSGTVEVDFTVFEKDGEMSSYDVMYALYNKIVAGDPAFAQNGLDLWSFRGYFINNPGGGGIPSAPTCKRFIQN